jgi:NAD-dependent deacetylase
VRWNLNRVKSGYSGETRHTVQSAKLVHRTWGRHSPPCDILATVHLDYPALPMTLMDPRLLSALRTARRVVIFTGAGVSAESGIPTFRDKQTGLWERFDAAELATPDAFERDPALVWGWYEWRRTMVSNAQPNPAHLAIAAMATLVPELTVITQNVDDLHERAGSREVLHLHGEILRPYCEKCRHPYTLPMRQPPAGGTRIEPPRCNSCNGRVRPGVVWFGESLPRRQWLTACEAARRCDVFFCIGTSSLVQPAASLTDLAIAAGATTVHVNPNSTDIDDAVTFALREPAGKILPLIVAEARRPT